MLDLSVDTTIVCLPWHWVQSHASLYPSARVPTSNNTPERNCWEYLVQVPPCTTSKNTEVQCSQEGLIKATPHWIQIWMQAQGGLCSSRISLLWWCHSCWSKREAHCVSGIRCLLWKCPHPQPCYSPRPRCSDCNPYSSRALGKVWEILFFFN